MTIERNTPFEPTRRISLPLNDNSAIHFAKLLADITINWGRIEHAMFTLIFFIDEKRGPDFARVFFRPTSIPAREKILIKQIEAVMTSTYPTYLSALHDTLVEYGNVRKRRNILAHGLWKQTGPSSFEVTPLQLNKSTGRLEKSIEVDLAYVSSLDREIDSVLQKLASLGTEMLAHQTLEKIKKRNTP